jgi:hypothetical protein
MVALFRPCCATLLLSKSPSCICPAKVIRGQSTRRGSGHGFLAKEGKMRGVFCDTEESGVANRWYRPSAAPGLEACPGGGTLPRPWPSVRRPPARSWGPPPSLARTTAWRSTGSRPQARARPPGEASHSAFPARLLGIEVASTKGWRLTGQWRFAYLPVPWHLTDFDFDAPSRADGELTDELAALRPIELVMIATPSHRGAGVPLA